jgi:hypothetical protein
MQDPQETGTFGTESEPSAHDAPASDRPVLSTFRVTHYLKSEGSDTAFSQHASAEVDADGAIVFIRERLLRS